MIIDIQVNRKEALRILKELEGQGVDITEALRDMEQRSPLYNVFYVPAMTSPSITYARG